MAEMASHQQPSSAGSGGTGGGTGGGGGGGGNNSQSQVKPTSHILHNSIELAATRLNSEFFFCVYWSVCLARCRPAAPLRAALLWSVRR